LNPEVEDRLMRYLDGEMDGAQVTDVLGCLARSAEARTLAAQLRQMGDVLRALPEARGDVADDIADRVMARIELDRSERQLGWRWPWTRLVPMTRPRGATVVAALIAFHCAALAGGAAADAAPKGSQAKMVKVMPSAAPAASVAYSAEILVLQANNGHRGIDPRIGDVQELRKSPFSSYKSYALIQKIRLPLESGGVQTLTLPNGRVLQAKLIEALPRNAARISASINQPGTKTFLPLLDVKANVGQPFIVAGQSYKSGILVLVIRLVT
jgi:anti-sigma factor RsiW